MNVAALFCDTFLIFDNDMLFLSDFELPSTSYYLPVVKPVAGSLEKFPWLNLLYTNRFHRFEYLNGSDSGGNFPIEGANKIIPCESNWEYITEYKILCNKFNVGPYYDILNINGAIVFHFRAMSNYTKYPEEFMVAKRELIMRFSDKLLAPC